MEFRLTEDRTFWPVVRPIPRYVLLRPPEFVIVTPGTCRTGQYMVALRYLAGRSGNANASKSGGSPYFSVQGVSETFSGSPLRDPRGSCGTGFILVFNHRIQVLGFFRLAIREAFAPLMRSVSEPAKKDRCGGFSLGWQEKPSVRRSTRHCLRPAGNYHCRRTGEKPTAVPGPTGKIPQPETPALPRVTDPQEPGRSPGSPSEPGRRIVTPIMVQSSTTQMTITDAIRSASISGRPRPMIFSVKGMQMSASIVII